jgi:hypothetical protein
MLKDLTSNADNAEQAANLIKEGRLYNYDAQIALAEFIIRAYGPYAAYNMADYMKQSATEKIRVATDKANKEAEAAVALLLGD